MSNPSLQEQLQALVSTSPSSDNKAEQGKKITKMPRPQHPKAPHTTVRKSEAKPQGSQKPAWLEYVHYGVELLKAHYPQCFKDPGEIKPLKVGIKQDLVKHLGTREDIVISDKSCMIKSLSYYVTTLNYFKTVLEGAFRIDLDGNQSGSVTTEEARYSAEQFKSKLQKKSARSQAKTPAA